MKKTTLLVLLGLFFLPSVASAAWWNPFTWHVGRAVTAPAEGATTTAATGSSTPDTSLLPSMDDLYKRIAELELKLDDAREQLKQANAKAQAPLVATPSPAPLAAAGLSGSDVMAKVRPAIVLVSTASSSASAVIIDAHGHILTTAHSVWMKDSSGNVVGAFPQATVTLSTGAQKTASLVGIDEANDLAVLQLSDQASPAYIGINYGSGLSAGDKVYVFGFPSGPANGASAFVSGVVAQRTSSAVQATTDDKPLDNGGAMVTNKGVLIGIPNPSACKVLEEMTTCLKYTVTAGLFPSRVPKVLAGMKLYKHKASETPDEVLIGGYLEGLYNSINQGGAVQYAIADVTGNNSFDYFNSKLGDDTEGKIAKVYLLKLKTAANNIYLAFDFLKSAAYALHVSLLTDSAAVLRLDGYQQQVIQGIQADNDARLKAYQSEVDVWSKKKSDYDSYLTRPSDATHDYLMAEGVAVESAAEDLGKESQKIIDSLSGETLGLF